MTADQLKRVEEIRDSHLSCHEDCNMNFLLDLLREQQAERIVKVKIGAGALTRDLVWCECGRGISAVGNWAHCPRCGGKIDQESYENESRKALGNGMYLYHDADLINQIAEQQAELEALKGLITAEGQHFAKRILAADDVNRRMRAERDALAAMILDAHGRALPSSWVYSGSRETIDLLVAEITTTRAERDDWERLANMCNGQIRELEAENKRLREALEKIIAGAENRFAQDRPSNEYQSLMDHDSGARLAWSVASKLAKAALAAPAQEMEAT